MRSIVVFVISLNPLLFAESVPGIVRSVNLSGSHLHVNLSTQVGRPYDSATVSKDLRSLWNLGRFEDIRVEKSQKPDGIDLTFHVVESKREILHATKIEPSTYGLRLDLPEGTPINRLRAGDVARAAQEHLRADGFPDARVEPKLMPYGENEVDLRLWVTAGSRLRVKEVDFTGEPLFETKQLRAQLRALRTRRVLPGFPGLWNGWLLRPAYTHDAAESDLTYLRSFYLSKGYLDANVRLDGVDFESSRATVRYFVDPGPRYEVRDTTIPKLCAGLLQERRAAEHEGILDFSATVTARRVDDHNPVVELHTGIDRGEPYRVGRINFVGNHHYRDTLLRGNLLIDEGALLDGRLLRKSASRLNRTNLFEPITERDIAIGTSETSGIANITIRLHERKAGAWNISGPVGPPSLAGPLEGSLSMRLPPWGSGLLQLSTYTASLSMYAFGSPILRAAGIKFPLLPVLALQRPFSPAEGWKSGFVIAPQLGSRLLAITYPVTQIQQRLIPLLEGDGNAVPELPVRFVKPSGESVLYCEPRQPRMLWLRRGAIFALRYF